ncbi:MAG: ABC transporter permease, partial [Chloroflexota bacterium]
AMLSVAAGVAAVVALRSLGLAIDESLTSNVRSTNKGDITLVRASGPGGFNFGSTSPRNAFSPIQLDIIRAWVNERGGTLAEYSTSNLQITAADRTAPLLNFMSGILIDPQTYPPTLDIEAIEPPGVLLGDLFMGGSEVVISANLAEAQDLSVGDMVRVTGTTEQFVVRGIVPTESEAGLRDLFAAFFGFAYFDQAQASVLNQNPQPNQVSILLPDNTTAEEIRVAADTLYDLLDPLTGFTRILTVPSIIEQNRVIADAISRFIVVMGLGAMLIGGVGIINTMLVMVRRRTDEIAALKTFGVKGRQVATIFMVEGLLLGLAGSLIGSVAGAFLSRLTNAYGEAVIQQSVPWRIYPEALLFGLVLGVVVTAVFSIVPVLTAVQVRPGIILRPNEGYVPALGVARSLAAVLFVVLSLGVIAGQIIGPFPESIRTFSEFPLPQNMTAGILLVATTLTILALLVGILWGIVWLISRLPSPRSVSLRLSLRNLGTRRLRTATTLLAISTGIFAISSISFYGAGVREILQVSLNESFGGNVLVLSPGSFALDNQAAETAQAQLNTTLDALGDAVTYRTRIRNYDGRVAAVDELSVRNLDGDVDTSALLDELRRAGQNQDFERVAEISQQIEALITPVSIVMRSTQNPNLETGEIARGRDLRPDDAGRAVAVVLDESRMRNWGVDIGSEIVIVVDGEEFSFEVVGIVANDEAFRPGALANITIPEGTLPEILPNFQFNALQVPPERVNEVELEITAMPFFFTVNVTLIDGVIARVINQFSALPILVGILSLGAAAVIMANTVALATLERRRQIGILKAIGLKRKRVVAIMLLENTIISVLGAFIGIGASALGITLLIAFGLDELVFIPEDARPVAVLLIIAAVIIGAGATVLSASSAASERVMNVLRYE